MKRVLVLITVLLGLIAAPSAMAGDHAPQSPCANGNPTDLCGPTVEVATPQECPTGGIALVQGETRFVICNPVNGTNGTNGAPGVSPPAPVAAPAPPTPPAPAKCKSRRIVNYTAPASYENGDHVKVIYDHRRRDMVVRHGKIKVDFRGLSCGVYSVVIRARGEEPFLRLATLGPNGSLVGYNVWVKLH